MAELEAVRLLLVGAPASALRLAAAMARDAGAEVVIADTPDDALAVLACSGAGLVMIDIDADVAGFMMRLRAGRFAVPLLACGVDAPTARAVSAIRAGALDYLPLPPERALIAAALALAAAAPADTMIGADAALLHALGFARAIAPSSMPVLISGETGTGKASVARMIHRGSGRHRRLVVVECSGIAPEVVEAELFGYAAGAFHGAAARRAGSLDKAAGGTLFIRDIHTLRPAAQGRLVEALQHADDVRLIAGSTADLRLAVAANTFRADLLAYLASAEIHLPPLRARRGDVPALAMHFAERAARMHGLPCPALLPGLPALLAEQAWPGNVGELEQVMQRAVILAIGRPIAAADVVSADGVRLLTAAPADEAEVTGLVGRTVEDVERALILRTLERCCGNRTSASEILGISVRTMRNKLKTFIEAGIPVVPAL